jgi:hypothetical protein
VWFNRKKKSAPAVTDPADMVRELREQALKVDVSEFPPAPQRPHVVGVMMETGYPQAFVSLVAFADGTTSLYFSTGGGIIGAGQHDVVYAATQEFLDAAEAHHAEFAPADATPPPGEGRVRFYVRTVSGILAAEADEDDLGYERHPLAPVFHAGHAVITAVQESTEHQ